MPFIHIKSLPFDHHIDIEGVITGLTDDFAKITGIGSEHITVTWEFIPAGNYVMGGKTSPYQPFKESHPVLVDLLTPDFNSGEEIEKMLVTVAKSIAKRTSIVYSNIFINHRRAYSGRVFDNGEIVRW